MEALRLTIDVRALNGPGSGQGLGEPNEPVSAVGICWKNYAAINNTLAPRFSITLERCPV